MSEIHNTVKGSDVPFILLTGGEVINQARKHVGFCEQKCDKVFNVVLYIIEIDSQISRQLHDYEEQHDALIKSNR